MQVESHLEFLKALEKGKLKLSDYKGLCFDLDGTLLDTEPIHEKALILTISEIGLDIIPLKLSGLYKGLPEQAVYNHLKQDFNLNIPYPDYRQKQLRNVLKLIKNLSKSDCNKLIIPGARQLLSLAKFHKMPMALVTASEEEIAHEVLEIFNLKKFFNIICTNQNTFKKKPSSSPYLYALRALGLKTGEGLIFEDSPTGLKAAYEAGSKAIQIIGQVP